MLVYEKLILRNKSEFIAKLNQVAKDLDINPNWLMLVFYLESGVNEKAINSKTGASGLIQFMPATAKGLGTSVEAIRQMSNVQQLDYVYKYFLPYRRAINGFTDLYLITFYPAALLKKRPDTWNFPKIVYDYNPGLDKNRDQVVNLGEWKRYILTKVPQSFPVAELVKKKAPELEPPPSLV